MLDVHFVILGALIAGVGTAWYVRGTVAVWASIAADLLAGTPTLRKSWARPETETGRAYACGACNAAVTLLTVTRVSTAVVAFPVLILTMTSLEFTLVSGRIGPRLRVRRQARAAT